MATPGAADVWPRGAGLPGPAHLEPHAARPGHQVRARAQRRHPSGHRPLGRVPAPTPARRHRQPPLLRLEDGRRARPAAFLARWPRLARFVSEFGAQAVPESDDFVEPERWPDLDWDGLARHHGLQTGRLRALRARRAPSTTYEDWKEATQRYQARLLRYQVETLRRLKYRPTGGFAQFCFADSSPAVTCSVLDHERVPKAGYDALRPPACRSSWWLDRPPHHVHPGDRLELDVHVVSDARISYSDMIVRTDLSWEGEVRRSWSWQGDIPADECVRVGTLDDRGARDRRRPRCIDVELDR